MRLNLEPSHVGSSAALLTVTGIIDWSTITQFRAGLSRLVSGPRPDVLVNFTGLVSWSPEAQQALGRRGRGSAPAQWPTGHDRAGASRNCWRPIGMKRCTGGR